MEFANNIVYNDRQNRSICWIRVGIFNRIEHMYNYSQTEK